MPTDDLTFQTVVLGEARTTETRRERSLSPHAPYRSSARIIGRKDGTWDVSSRSTDILRGPGVKERDFAIVRELSAVFNASAADLVWGDTS
jgi:hypothetical protein